MPFTVEVLVVSYASAQVIRRLLATLALELPGVQVAIREHSDLEAMRSLAQVASNHRAPVRLEHDPTNPGFGAGCNALAANSTADFLVFLNPDTEVVNWPWSPTKPPPSDTVVGPLMVESGPPSEHFGRSYRIRDELALSWFRRRPNRPAGQGYVSGAALLIERAAFDQLGGFDESFFLFYEDIDLCLRANAAGYRTVVDDDWRVRHHRHHSTGARFAESIIWSYESAVQFHAKYGSPVWLYRLYVTADSMLRAIWHRLRGRRKEGRAYYVLARRASSELLRPSRVTV